MLEELIGRRLRSVERLVWQPDDESTLTTEVGPVHIWFDDGRGLHLSGASDWTLRCSVSDADDGWLSQYDYHFHGRWIRREATQEEPFAGLSNATLVSVTPILNEVNETVGVDLDFADQVLSLRLWEGEIRT